MKILILTITAGEGHNATAASIREALTGAGHECTVVDTWLQINRGIYNIISKGYLLSTADFKRTYAWAYARLEKRKVNSYSKSLTRSTYRMIKKKLLTCIQEHDPDVIVYTHIFAGIFLDVIAEQMPLRARTVGILTDFAMHPFWEEALRTDRVILPNELLIPAAKRKGLQEGQLVPSGIPIRTAFSRMREKGEARKALGLEDKPTLLVMGGSMGYGSLADHLKALDEPEDDMQLICVCGNNKKAKEEIDALTFRHRVLNFGFTDQIDLLMDAADCIVTKPGGLTTSEALAKRLPIIIANPIPGQEDRNAEFLLNNGAAAMTTKTTRLTDVVYQLFHDPRRLRLMQENIDLIRKPNATADLVALVESLCPASPALPTGKDKACES